MDKGLSVVGSIREESRGGGEESVASDLGLQWGNRKRLRCMKVLPKHTSSGPVHRVTVRVDRRVVTTDMDPLNKPTLALTHNNIHQTNGYPNLRRRSSSPHQTILRKWESSSAMRGGQSNGVVRGIASPDRDKRGTHNNNLNDNNKSPSDGSPSGSGDAAPPVWPPKFMIALTNKEKEEDFLAIKGSKLPVRPRKRAKFVQRTLNLVTPGAWLCDLTLERYEVREKKVSKKKPTGLRAMGSIMGNMESDSE